MNVKSVINLMTFLILNFIGNLFLSKIGEIKLGNNKIIGFKKEYLENLIRIWNYEVKFSKKDKFMLYFFGKKTCYLMIDNNGRLLAFMYFYFNLRNFVNRRIHAALACMSPDCRGKGLGTVLYNNVFDSLMKNKWIFGISTRWSLNNEAPGRIMKKYGFKVIEEYFDEETREKRVYAVYMRGKN